MTTPIHKAIRPITVPDHLLTPGLEAYHGTTANGLQTVSLHSWDGSELFFADVSSLEEAYKLLAELDERIA